MGLESVRKIFVSLVIALLLVLSTGVIVTIYSSQTFSGGPQVVRPSYVENQPVQKIAQRGSPLPAYSLPASTQADHTQENAPKPLMLPDTGVPGSSLTVEGVLRWTNTFRKQHAQPPLTLNQTLNKVAEKKVTDMYSREYFAHVSPLGVSPETLVKESGYKALVSGENLALGNFTDDRHLVQAWMDSPGHRENLLRPSFTEIGIGVEEGEFKGRKVWVAVQTFGTPQSVCPSPDENLMELVERNKGAVADGTREILSLKGQIESGTFGDDTGEAMASFNELNRTRMDLVAMNNRAISEYNEQVERFNGCIAGYAGSVSPH